MLGQDTIQFTFIINILLLWLSSALSRIFNINRRLFSGHFKYNNNLLQYSNLLKYELELAAI